VYSSMNITISKVISCWNSKITDSINKVHDASYQVFGEIIDLLGECAVQGFINQLDTSKFSSCPSQGKKNGTTRATLNRESSLKSVRDVNPGSRFILLCEFVLLASVPATSHPDGKITNFTSLHWDTQIPYMT